jgi:chemotaxis signal transduction protein
MEPLRIPSFEILEGSINIRGHVLSLVSVGGWRGRRPWRDASVPGGDGTVVTSSDSVSSAFDCF